MNKLILIFAALVPWLAFGAAGDIKVPVKNSSDTAWVDQILAKTNSSMIGTNASGTTVPIVIGSGLSLSGNTLIVAGAGTGNVTGPGSSTTNGIATFGNTSGELLASPAWTLVSNTLTSPNGGTVVDGSGSLALSAGGANQNIIIVPSGTAVLSVRSNGSGSTPSGIAEFVKTDTTSGFYIGYNPSTNDGVIGSRTNAAGLSVWRFNGTSQQTALFSGLGNLLIGTTTDFGSGSGQLKVNSNAAVGGQLVVGGSSLSTNVLLQAQGAFTTSSLDTWGLLVNPTLTSGSGTLYGMGVDATYNVAAGTRVAAGIALFDMPTSGTGSVTAMYGLYLAAMSGTSSTKYAIYDTTGTTWNSNSVWNTTNATASTSTTTGAAVITGGLGVGGASFFGGTGSFTGNLSALANFSISGTGATGGANSLTVTGSSGNYAAYLIGYNSTGVSNGLLVNAGTNSSDVAFAVRSNSGSSFFKIDGTGASTFTGGFTSTNATAGTSTSSGAFIVNNVFAVSGSNGNVYSSGSGNFAGGAAITGGTFGVGGAQNAGIGVYIQNTALSGTSQYAIAANPVFTSSATTSGRTIQAAFSTAAASFTMANGYGVYVAPPTIGSGSIVTTLYGLYVDNQTGGGTNYAIFTSGTAPSQFGGPVNVSNSSTSLVASTFTSTGASGFNLSQWTMPNIAGTPTAAIGVDSATGAFVGSGSGNSFYIRSNNTTSVTIDTSHNATFVANISAVAFNGTDSLNLTRATTSAYLQTTYTTTSGGANWAIGLRASDALLHVYDNTGGKDALTFTSGTQAAAFAGQVRPGTYTVSGLPTGTSGAYAIVTDSTVAYSSTTRGSTVTGGGSNYVPMFFNGTSWVAF